MRRKPAPSRLLSMRHPVAPPQSVDTMNSIAPQDIWRSEAFAEDLFDDSTPGAAPKLRVQMLSNNLLCALPVAVALLGGVMAFFHTIG